MQLENVCFTTQPHHGTATSWKYSQTWATASKSQVSIEPLPYVDEDERVQGLRRGERYGYVTIATIAIQMFRVATPLRRHPLLARKKVKSH